MKTCLLFLAVGLLLLKAAALLIDNCNEAICASVVSKCMLTQSCKCDLKNCSCCKECFSCLDDLFDDCCSCVDMCVKPNSTTTLLTKTSHVEEFSDAYQNLFLALTEENDTQERWISYKYAVDLNTALFGAKLNDDLFEQNSKNIITVNCTVAFMTNCIPWNKCKEACHSMGSSSYRWFHDGCCECIGEGCINYGINESRCKACPLPEGEDEDLLEEDYIPGVDVEQEL